jgi:hypothetical protein
LLPILKDVYFPIFLIFEVQKYVNCEFLNDLYKNTTN